MMSTGYYGSTGYCLSIGTPSVPLGFGLTRCGLGCWERTQEGVCTVPVDVLNFFWGGEFQCLSGTDRCLTTYKSRIF